MKETDFQAKVILISEPSCGKTLTFDSLGGKTLTSWPSCGKPLITIQIRYPRIIHSEVITHRAFSRNARSSRAVPVKNLLAEEIYTPYFMKNQPGMQSFEKFSIEEQDEIQKEWNRFAKETQRFSKWLSYKGVHKQWANRPLEWFGYIDTLITATDWDNYFALRIHKDAMPEIRELAKVMDKEIARVIQEKTKGVYQVLYPTEWHLPYISVDDYISILENDNQHNGEALYIPLLKLSVARCARVSYAPFDGNASLEKEFQRFELLRDANPIHASPFEHQAKMATWTEDPTGYGGDDDYIRSNLAFPWIQYRKIIEQTL